MNIRTAGRTIKSCFLFAVATVAAGMSGVYAYDPEHFLIVR